MNKIRKYLVALIMGFLLFPSCHFMEKKEKQSKLESSKRGIASVTPNFVFKRIPAGSFTMGSPAGEKNRDKDENQVQVEISRPFEIMVTEVTQAQYVRVMGKNPSYFKGTNYCNNYDSVKNMCPDLPVEWVSWIDIQNFIKKLNESKGLKGCKGRPSDPKGCYRLPTEAEWEYSARAGTTTAYFFGNDASQIGNYAVVYSENSREQTQRVGSKSANPWVLYDMLGNVQEWVQNTYQPSLRGGKDPLVNYASNRVIRGGSWYYGFQYSRVANREWKHPGTAGFEVGFRLVRTL